MSAGLLTEALRNAEAGLSVFPVEPRGKRPLTEHGLHDASTDEATIRGWWGRWPDANIGARTGERFVVIDVDNPSSFDGLLETHHAPVPETLTARTGRGFHLFFTTPDFPVRNSTGKLAAGIDVRGHAGYVILPPSIHPNGSRYEWTNPVTVEPLPDWLASLLRPSENGDRSSAPPMVATSDRTTPYGRAALETETRSVAAAVEGTRNNTLNNAALKLGSLVAGGELDEDEARAALESAAATCGLPEREALATIESGLAAGLQQPRRAPATPSCDPAPAPAADLVRDPWTIDAADLLAEPDPGPTPWLVDGLIVDRAIVAAVGRWKTTKSYGTLDLCIAIATGRPAFGRLAIPNPGPVLFINEESGRAALWRRLDALCRGRAINPEELRGRLIVAANARVRLDDLGWQKEIVRTAERLSPRLICFDPLARMKAAARKENEQSDMAVLIDYVRHLRDEAGAAVLFVHHTGHAGDHMRGASDLESAWETRLAWKRDGQSPEVTIDSEHREAESAGAVRYRIVWDGDTRTMRFDLIEDDLFGRASKYLSEHPEASANEVAKALGGNRTAVLAAVKTVRSEGGSSVGNHPGTTPPEAPSAGGSPALPVRGAGTTTAEPGSESSEPPPIPESELEALWDDLHAMADELERSEER